MKQALAWLLAICSVSMAFAQTDTPPQDSTKMVSDTSEQVDIHHFSVFFPTASHEVGDSYFADLDTIAKQSTTANSIQLSGYTDNVGDTTANHVLSQERVEAVRAYLAQAGVPDSLMQILAFGESNPKADNSTEAGRKQNRRVEINIYSSTRTQEEFTARGDTTLYETPDIMLDELKSKRGKLVERTMPSPRKFSGVRLNAVQRNLTSSNGGTINVKYNYDSGDARPKKLLWTIAGAAGFYEEPLAETATKGKLSLKTSFPTQLAEGEIAIVASLLNANGQLSKKDTVFVKLERVGTGKLQISLSWDTETDQDLHIVTPAEERIWYRNKIGENGGALDRDDRDGHGPENVFWETDAPDGTYTIYVHDYEKSATENAFIITVNGLGTNEQFYGSTRHGAKEKVTTFTKEGDTISWGEEETVAEKEE